MINATLLNMIKVLEISCSRHKRWPKSQQLRNQEEKWEENQDQTKPNYRTIVVCIEAHISKRAHKDREQKTQKRKHGYSKGDKSKEEKSRDQKKSSCKRLLGLIWGKKRRKGEGRLERIN